MAANPSDQKRIFIWNAPRSLSTVFTRSLSQIPDSYALIELFSSAGEFGPECYDYKYPSKDGFESMKAIYEQPWPGKSVIIAKECSHALNGKYDFLPEGYQHVFITRHPLKSISSYAACIGTIPKEEGFQIGFKPLQNLHHYLKTVHGINAPVLDADDLIAQPKEMLQRICQILGLPFSERLLTWNATDEKPDNWMVRQALWENQKVCGWFRDCLNSTGFRKPTESAKININALAPEFVKEIKGSLPYYEELRKLRIQP